MRRTLLVVVVAGCAALVFGWWLGRGVGPMAPAPAETAVVDAPQGPTERAAPAAPGLPEPEAPAAPVAELRSAEDAPGAPLAAPVSPPRRVPELHAVAEVPTHEVEPSGVAVEAAPEAEPASKAPTLDALLRVPPRAPAPRDEVEWAGKREAGQVEGAPRKPRPRIDYSRENLTKDAPTQDPRHRTDVGVSVPVDEADRVRIKGGVRVDERAVSETEKESEKTPTVGVEVKF